MDIKFKQKYEKEGELIWKNIKGIKKKKILLLKYIDNINERNENKLVVQKNKLLLKSLYSNLNHIDDNNIIFESGEISNIIGITKNEDGLLIISKDLYKEKRIRM